MFLRILLILNLPLLLWGASLSYGLYAHDLDEEAPITRFQIFGERCSGTKYLSSLLGANFPDLSPGMPFGNKHLPAWYHLPKESYPGPDHHYTLKGEEFCLFVVIFRNPFDWLRSMHRSPYFAAPHLHNTSIHRFIALPWEIRQDGPENVRQIEKDPLTGKPFKNVLHLRTAKIENMLRLKTKVSHIYYVNYETVRDFPEKVVEEIAEYFYLERNEPFRPISYECSGDPSYGERSQQEISFQAPTPYTPAPNLRRKILKELDLDLERSIGYELESIRKPAEL